MHLIYTRKRFWKYVGPLAILYSLMLFLPLLVAIYLSFTNYGGFGPAKWIGIKNYIHMAKDKYVWIAFSNTLKMVLVSTCVGLPVSFFLALALNKDTKKNFVYKSVFFTPYVIPGVIAGLAWVFIFDPTIGLLNNVLRELNLEVLCQDWIGGMKLSPYSIATVMIWSALGFQIAVWLTGLKGIPMEILEAAELDGVSPWQKVRFIILPMVKETLLILLVFAITNGFKTFELVYQMTGGGPNHASESLVSYMYNLVFGSWMYGYGIAVSVFLFLISLVLTVVSTKLIRSKD